MAAIVPARSARGEGFDTQRAETLLQAWTEIEGPASGTTVEDGRFGEAVTADRR